MEVKSVFDYLNIDCEVDNIKRVGTYSLEKARNKIVIPPNERLGKQFVLLVQKLSNYEKIVYVSKASNTKEQIFENKLLPKSWELINEGDQLKNLRLSDLKLQHLHDKSRAAVDVDPADN